MKFILLCSFFSYASLHIWAQTNDVPNQAITGKAKVRLDRGPAIYVTTSSRLNNNTAIMGFNFEVPLSPYVTLDGAPGTGTWNYKVYLGVKRYLRTAQRGFAFGTGLTYANGTRGHLYWATTIYGDRVQLKFNKNPQTNVLFAAYKYWSLGKQYNRVFAQLGWSVPLSGGDKLTQLSGPPITSDSRNSIGSGAPGGPIVAAGVSFGLH